MKEIYKKIEGYNGYLITNLGDVYSLKSKRLLSPINSNGYHLVSLSRKGGRDTHRIHRLVLAMFKGRSNLEVNHINGIRSDNRLENLEYCTRLENVRHAIDVTKTHKAKLTLPQVSEIKKRSREGTTIGVLAEEFKVTSSTICRIKNGKMYRYVV